MLKDKLENEAALVMPAMAYGIDWSSFFIDSALSPTFNDFLIKNNIRDETVRFFIFIGALIINEAVRKNTVNEAIEFTQLAIQEVITEVNAVLPIPLFWYRTGVKREIVTV